MKTAKVGFSSSDGCTDMPARLSHRRAPLYSAPATSVSAVAASATTKSARATRLMPRGEKSETVSTISTPMGR